MEKTAYRMVYFLFLAYPTERQVRILKWFWKFSTHFEMLCLGIKNTLLSNWSTSRCAFLVLLGIFFFYRKYHLDSSRVLVQSHISSRFVFGFFDFFFKSRFFVFVFFLRIQNFLYTLLKNGICTLVHSNSQFKPIPCSPHDVLLIQTRLIKLGSACSNC